MAQSMDRRSFLKGAGSVAAAGAAMAVAGSAGIALTAGAEEAAGGYADGTYTASGMGMGGDVPVTVVIEGGKIASVEIGENSETQGIGSKAVEQLPSAIVEAGGTEGVNGGSGASITSKAIFSAVNDCLEQAAGGSGDEDAASSSAQGDGGQLHPRRRHVRQRQVGVRDRAGSD